MKCEDVLFNKSNRRHKIFILFFFNLSMAQQGINLPQGFAGLVRYNEEFSSYFNIKPIHVILFIILIVVFRFAMPFFL